MTNDTPLLSIEPDEITINDDGIIIAVASIVFNDELPSPLQCGLQLFDESEDVQ